MATLAIPVAAGGDDVVRRGRPRASEEYFIDFDYFSTKMNRFGDAPDGVEMEAAFRFQVPSIESGDTINAATVEMVARSTDATADCNILIVGEDTDDASAYALFSDFDSGFASATSASVAWNSIEFWTAESVYYTPDITSIIQEIVNRPGWSPDNYMQIILSYVLSTEGHRRDAYSYEADSNKAPILNIDYTAGGGIISGKSTKLLVLLGDIILL